MGDWWSCRSSRAPGPQPHHSQPPYAQVGNYAASADVEQVVPCCRLLPKLAERVMQGPADFKICGWRTNDAKGDLLLEDFVALCSRVVSAHSACHKPSGAGSL